MDGIWHVLTAAVTPSPVLVPTTAVWQLPSVANIWKAYLEGGFETLLLFAMAKREITK